MTSTTLRLRDGRAVRVRVATNADADAVVGLIFRVLKEYDLKGDPAGTDACLTNIESHYTSAGGLFEVVEAEDGEMLGCYGLMPDSGETCELRKMYLASSARGQGLGRQLLSRALAAARELGFRRVELTTAAPLKEALALYKSFGFTEFAKPDLPSRCDRALALSLT